MRIASTLGQLFALPLVILASSGSRAADVDEPSVAVALETVVYGAMRDTMTAYGTVEYAPDQAEVLSVQGEGLVSQVRVAPGQHVRKGDVLIELTPTANSATELEHAGTAREFARKDLERLQDLRTRQLATNAEVRAAEENLVRAESSLANVRRRLGDTHRRALRADMDGYIEAVHVHVGDIAAPAAPLLLLARGDRLRVRVGIEPEDLSRIREGQKVLVRALYPAARPVAGHVQHVYYQVDPKTRLAEAMIPLGASRDVLPGTMVKAEVILAERPQVLIVPREAVLFRNGEPYVFVAQEGRAHLRRVALGTDDGRRVEVRVGVAAGEAVVATGNYELQDGMALRDAEAQ